MVKRLRSLDVATSDRTSPRRAVTKRLALGGTLRVQLARLALPDHPAVTAATHEHEHDPHVRVAYCPVQDPDTIYVDPDTPLREAVHLVAYFADVTAAEAERMLLTASYGCDHVLGPPAPRREAS